MTGRRGRGWSPGQNQSQQGRWSCSKPVTQGLRPGYDVAATKTIWNRRHIVERTHDWSQRSWVIARGNSVATRSMVMLKTCNLLFQIVSGRTISRATDDWWCHTSYDVMLGSAIRGKSLTRTSSLRRTPTTVADHGYTADSGSILIARCRHLIAGWARSIVCNRTVWHNETR